MVLYMFGDQFPATIPATIAQIYQPGHVSRYVSSPKLDE
jgi:hypothetical protein